MRRRKRNVLTKFLGSMLVALLCAPAAFAQSSSSAASENPFGECPVNSPTQDQKLEHYSLYYENFKNEDYKAALPDLRWMLRCAPTFGGSPSQTPSEKNLNRALDVYSNAAETVTGDAQRAYLDSALMVIDAAPGLMEAAGGERNEFDWTFERGYFILSHSQQLADLQDEAAKAFRQAYEISPEELVGQTQDSTYYVNQILRSYSSQGNTEEMMKFINSLQKDFSTSDKVMGVVSKYMSQVPTDDRIAFLESRLESNPNNAEIASQLFSLYREQGMRDKMYELGQRMLENNPTPATFRALANMYREDGEYQQSLDYFQKLESMEGAELTAEDYYNMGLAQENMGRLSSARSSFRQALEQDPQYGRAYMAIGDLYASAVQQCMSGALQREDKAVYWLAVDKYQKAKSVSPNLEASANQKINTYRQYYPTQEDLFFWEKQAGDRYAVDSGCYSWIGETTTVRQPS